MRKIKFITGGAGTGKSTKLRDLTENETRSYLKVAPTGIAAVNIDGSTIHRTFKLHSETNYVSRKWPHIEVVYVDEASMVGARMMSAILAGAPNAEIVMIGDMAQLPPVKDRYWFEAPEFNREFSTERIDIEIEKLTKNYRQGNDRQFAEVLNSIRKGEFSRKEIRYLYSNSKEWHPDEFMAEGCVTLAFRNDTVRAINSEMLLNIPGDTVAYEAEYTGIMKPTDCKAEQVLVIKEGCNIIMLNNDKDGRWRNGTMARVTRIPVNGEFIEVEIGKSKHMVVKHRWTIKTPEDITPTRRQEIETLIRSGKVDQDRVSLLKHFLETGIEYVESGSAIQYPMKLAYAMTVHKSQGMTLERIHIDSSGFRGSYGIGYVALSRATRLSNVSFERSPAVGDFRFDNRLERFI